MLAEFTGPNGRVHAFEIDQGLAERTAQNVAHLPWVTVHHRSGVDGDLPKVDTIYVNAGLTQPSKAWLDALRWAGG